jgi:hypothetical protein
VLERKERKRKKDITNVMQDPMLQFPLYLKNRKKKKNKSNVMEDPMLQSSHVFKY